MAPSKIKLCIIHPNLQCGGSERFISIICNNINTEIFSVELYILDGAQSFYKITNPDIKVTFLAIRNVRNSLFAILKIIKKSRPHILFTASNHLNLFLGIFKFLLPGNLKLVARESNTVSVNNKRSKYGRLYEWLTKRFYKNINHIICQCAYMQNDLVRNYKIDRKNTVIIYNPVEEIKYSQLQISSNKFQYKFFTVARLSPEKGIDRVLNALALLNIDFSYYIIGDGGEKNNLQQLTRKLNLQNKVFFEGQKLQPYDNMPDADLFLIGSRYEGFPNVLLEAGVLGIPAVGFNSPGGISEIIVDGVNGFLAEDHNIRSYADQILKAINYNFNRDYIINMTKERFSANKITNEVERYLLKVSQ